MCITPFQATCVLTEACPGRSFVANPCSTCATHASASTLLHAKYAVKILYPEFISLSVVNTTRTSVQLQYDVTTPGTAFYASMLLCSYAPITSYKPSHNL
jgi:hypothetical protein